jgi:imidazole glycerol phosphate synthase glutamine amidotransferase subunit
VSTSEVIIVRTGSANLASVIAAFTRLKVAAVVSEDPDRIVAAPLVVLPGVGAFGPAMAHLRERGLDMALRIRIGLGRPLLAICLGMQLLCEASDESPGVRGLAIIPGRIRRFEGVARVPQMGWNRIEPGPDAELLRSEWMYFANSFRLGESPGGWSGATTDYGGPFVSALERGPILACQFHPELSGEAGASLLERWLACSGECMQGAAAC